MNLQAKSFFTALAMILLTSPTFASMPSSDQIIHDKPSFFVHLDVDKLLATTDISSQCGTIPAKLDYLDHQGREHVLDYQVEGIGCTNDH